MVLSGKVEGILGADVALRLARDALHKKNILVNDEIRAQHAPLTAAIQLANKDALDILRREVNDRKVDLDTHFA